MTMRGRLLAVSLLALLGAGLSGLLLLQHRGEGQAAVSMMCGEGAESGCAEVSRSPYAEVRGIPLAALGLLFYFSLALLLALAAIAEAEDAGALAGLALVLVALALAVDLWLLGVQAFALRAFCRLCLATYAVNAAALVALGPARRQVGALCQLPARPVGRVALAGWVLGSVGLAAAVAAADVALAYREVQRAALLLGPLPAPAPARSPAPGPPAPVTPAPAASPAAAAGPEDIGRYREQAHQAEERARKLQEILDDPNKLQDYFNDKAAREFAQAPVQELDLAATPFKGPVAAPVRVVEFSDFLCPWCRSLAGAFSSYLPRSGGRVSIYFKNYPLDQACNPNLKHSVHAGACWLASAGICAHEQGRFWAYHDRVYGSPPKDPQRDDVVRMGVEAGLSGPALEACMGSQKTKDRIAADVREAQRLGVSSTPTVFINGKKLPSINAFLMAVDKESQRLGLPPLPPPQAQPK